MQEIKASPRQGQVDSPIKIREGLCVCMLTPGSMLHDARIQKEARGLRDKGCKVRIVCIEDYKVMDQFPIDGPQWEAYRETMSGIETRSHILQSRKWRGLPKFINRLFQSLEMSAVFLVASVRFKADVYHCHDLIPGFFACLAKLIHRGKLVYDAHEMETEMGGATGFFRKLLGWYERFVISYSDAAITVNDYIRKVMEEAYGRPVVVIENRPEIPDLLDKKYLRRKFSIPDDVTVVIYVGFLSMARGIDKMVRAMSLTSTSVHFYLLGTGRIDEFKKEVYDLAKKNGVDPERIVFMAPVQPQEVLKVLCGADISIMLYQKLSANNQINTPNKLFQSVVAEVPILASENRSFNEFLKRGDEVLGLTVDESDPEAIAKGIEEIREKGEEIRRTLAKYKDVYTWQGQQERLFEIYSKF